MSPAASQALQRLPPRSTPIDAIGKALHALWQSSADDDRAIARSLTLNLIAVTDAGNEAVLQQATDRLMQRSPARAILLIVDDSLSAPTAAVAAVARCNNDRRDLVLEEVRLRLPSAWFRHVPGLLRPLLIGDLPTHVYWARDLAAHDDLAGLMQDCDHGIVDSCQFATPALDLQTLTRLRQSGHKLTDLAWLRLRPWRRALAEAFERVQWAPGSATRGVVRHGEGATAGAILLALWIEERLGAKIALEDSAPPESNFPAAVRLEFDGHEVDVQCDGGRLVVKVTTPVECHLPFQLPQSTSSEGDLLAAAIDIA